MTPSSMQWALLSVALIATLASLIADHKNLLLQRYLFKPLPVLLMVLVVLSASQVNLLIRTLFIVALVMSALGDVLLIDRRRFVFGLAAFLVAHLFYIVGIGFSLEDSPRFWIMLPLALWGGTLFWLIKEGLEQVRVPVIIYISVILVMVGLAFEYHHQFADQGTLLLLVGALLFGVSDSVLALDHFKRPFIGSKAIILSTYYAAQIFIALSLVFHGVAL